MTLDELLAKVPADFKPWAEQYGPAFLSMGVDEVNAWLQRIIVGDVFGAYEQVLAKMPGSSNAGEWVKQIADWKTQNVKNAAMKDLAQQAAIALAKAMLVVVLAMVGL